MYTEAEEQRKTLFLQLLCLAVYIVLHTTKLNKTYYVKTSLEGRGLLVNLSCIPTCAVDRVVCSCVYSVHCEHIPYMVMHNFLCHLRRRDQWKLNKLSSLQSR